MSLHPNDVFADFPSTRSRSTETIRAKAPSSGKNGYELRADMLALAWEIIKHRSATGSIGEIKTSDVIEAARNLYGFVNDNPNKKE